MVRLRECGESLYGKRSPLKLIGAVRLAIFHGSEAYSLKESKTEVSRKTELRHESNVWSKA